MGTNGELWRPISGDQGYLWGRTGTYNLWGPIRELLGPKGCMGTYRDPCGRMGTYVDLWVPLGTNGDQFGPVGSFGDL